MLGVDYYPEQWSRDRWEVDLAAMRAAGLRVVRLAEFSWGLFEPREGVFDWSWLDDFMRLLAAYELSAILCTPTATPPAWLTHTYPATLRVDEQGRQMHPGSRRYVCANSPVYQRLALRITERIAERYGNHERVIAWQTDNEFGCHDTIRCTCSECESAFQVWLREKHGSLDALNSAWGTPFWSQWYTEWEQIQPPRATPAGHNPGLMLDYDRFSSDSWVAFNRAQCQLLRKHAPLRPLTHNLMIFFLDLDHFELAKSLDFVSWDNYHHHGAQPVTVAANHDLMWGAKEKNFWVIEQQAGQVNWSRFNPQFAPGQLTLKTLQAVAHGAESVLYFRWRQARFGAEMYHSGLLDYAGRPTRAHSEVRALGGWWNALMALVGEREPEHHAGFLFDFASHWALEFQPHTESLDLAASNDEEILYVGGAPLEPMNRGGLYFLPWYEALWRNNLQAAIISPLGNLGRYPLLFAPQLHIVTEAHAAKLTAWVEGGGTLVLGPRTGFKGVDNALPPIPQPAALIELVGGKVIEFETREPNQAFLVDFGDFKVTGGVWAELWEAHRGTTVLATYADANSYFHGYPAVLHKKHGKGQVITMGTFGGWQLIEALFPILGLSAPIRTPNNVEAVRRGDALFLLNHNPTPQEVRLPQPMRIFQSGEVVSTVKLDGYGFRIFDTR